MADAPNYNDLVERYRHHPPTGEAIEVHEQIRAKSLDFALWLRDTLPASREASLAQTALQEAAMWSNAAVAIHISGKSDTLMR